MMLALWNGVGALVLRCIVRDSTLTNNGGKTALTSASSGLIISTIADNEATSTTYTQAGSTIETIATLGTFATPTATKCRFKLVDDTNHPGLYEIQIANARWAVSGARYVIVTISGVSGATQENYLVQLPTVNIWDGTNSATPAIPAAAAGGNNGLPVNNVLGHIQADVSAWNGDPAGITTDANNLPVVALGATGLDAVTATTPSGLATTFPAKMMQLWARFFGRAKKDATTIKTYRVDGTTVATTQTYTSTGGVDDVGAAS